MPVIKQDYSGNRAEDKNDLRLEIHSHSTNRDFEFVVRRNSVEVTCKQAKNKRKKEPEDDWRKALKEEEKLRVISLILDEYRKHSIGDEHGYRGAVLGVSESGDIFLGANTATEQITSPYLKECAEQNMVSAASDLVAYKQVKTKGWENFDRPKAPIFESLYMMGGVNEEQVPVSCPCGKCTDMLAKNMKKEAKVYTLPILNQATFDYLNSTGTQTLGVDIDVNRSDTLQEVRGQVTRKTTDVRPLTPYPVWQTTIQHLNNEREIDLTKLDEKIAGIQRAGYAKLCADAKEITGLREEVLAEQHKGAMADTRIGSTLKLFQSFMSDLFAKSHRLSKGAGQLLGLDLGEKNPIAMAAANQFVGRRSIAELDAAAAGGASDIVAINEFMLSEIRHTLADRILMDPDKKGMWVKSIQKAVPHIRCVVIQLDDGTFYHAVECAGKYDASLPNAEVSAVVQALPSLGRCHIKDVWVMEMNGVAANKGVLMTSPKEGAERIIKRSDETKLQFHFIPLNSGQIMTAETAKGEKIFRKMTSQEIEDITINRSAAEVMPALFKGSRPLGEKAVSAHRPWSDFLSMQAANAESARLRA